MTPQSHFTVVAPVIQARAEELRLLLMSMNDRPGMASPTNPILPFGAFNNLHFARIVILDDPTLHDFAEFGAPIPDFAVLFALIGDCDGPADRMLVDLAQHAEPGLRQLFSCCEDFSTTTDVLKWMRTHSQPSAANYVNWIGRTVQQITEEARLRDELVAYITANLSELELERPQSVRRRLVAHARALLNNGDLTLTASQRTPLGWSLRNFLHFASLPGALLLPWLVAIPVGVKEPRRLLRVAIPAAAAGVLLFVVLRRWLPASFATVIVCGVFLAPLLLVSPVLIVPASLAATIFLLILRHYERHEPEVIHRPPLEHILRLGALEDHSGTNQYTALGSVKPSRFRRALFPVLLWIIDYFARHVYTKGHLGRIRSIHFAHWTFLDCRKRMMFVSNYDGSHEAYMDDFINKAGWGLNLAFTCGLGYPRTRWIIKDGIDDELKFKYTQRRHQVPTDTWYNAYPGLTAFDLERNTRVRSGLERKRMSDEQVRVWLQDL